MKSAFVTLLQTEQNAAATTIQRGWRTFRPRVCMVCNRKIRQINFVTSECICNSCYEQQEYEDDYIECYVCGANATDGPYWGFCSRRCMNS